MKVQTRYRVHQHHKFEHGGRKYAADLETGSVIEINEVEWELLNRDLTETSYATVEGLKSQFKTDQIFEGIERLQQLSKRRCLLSPTEGKKISPRSEERLKLLVPLQFVQEKWALDPVTNENRYHLLAALSKQVELETLNISGKPTADFGEFISIRDIETVKTEPKFPMPWYAMDDYDGILLLSQSVWEEILYYSQDVPILHCVESDRKLQDVGLEKILEQHTAQKTTDLILPKASWISDWLSDFGVRTNGMHPIAEGINLADPIGKALAKQHTAAMTENSMFERQPVVGIISGFKLHTAVQFISELATSNPHIVFFVYDSILAEGYRKPPNNVIFFRAYDEETRAVLPIFFQALDLVCFPAVPGTSASLVLEAMAYGTPAVVISKYGLPSEVEGAGVLVQCPSHIGNDLDIPIPQVSKAINKLLKDTKRRGAYKQIAKGFGRKYTWERTAQEIVRLFKQRTGHTGARDQFSTPVFFPPLFCKHYDPRTGTTSPRAYRQETNQFEPLENTLAEVLSKYHTSAEVETVFKHFQRDLSLVGNGLTPKG